MPAETEEPSPEPTQEPTPTPEPLRDANGDLRFPDGSVYHGYEVKISLPKLEGKDVERTIELLGEMPNVHTVDLGARKAGRLLALSSIEKLQAACPDVNFIFRFSLWGKEVSTADKELDLKYIPMDDEGAAVIRALRVMPKCTYLDMDTCGVSSEAMGKIREQFPDVEVVWRIWFGKEFSVRTDCERIIATNHLNDANSKDLKYCTKVRLLDVGHNPNLTDISFLTDMTELECCKCRERRPRYSAQQKPQCRGAVLRSWIYSFTSLYIDTLVYHPRTAFSSGESCEERKKKRVPGCDHLPKNRQADSLHFTEPWYIIPVWRQMLDSVICTMFILMNIWQNSGTLCGVSPSYNHYECIPGGLS